MKRLVLIISIIFFLPNYLSAELKTKNEYFQRIAVNVDIDKRTLNCTSDMSLSFPSDGLTRIQINKNITIKYLKYKVSGVYKDISFKVLEVNNVKVLSFTLPYSTSLKKADLQFKYSVSIPKIKKREGYFNSDDIYFGSYIDSLGSYISEEYLWYPVLKGYEYFKFNLKVITPKGQEVISSGNLVRRAVNYTETETEFDFPFRANGIPLIVGPYKISKKVYKDLSFYTYFFEDESDLTDIYLNSIEGYIKRYEELIGKYPFSQFSVVSNVMPTGYGFPGFTLLGSAVLRLPFIVKTSLGHEILHNWWGNSVYVDYEKGNWAEGLTTLMADYAYKAEKGEEFAKNARREAILNYQSYVNKKNIIPVERFVSRSESYLKAIGYDKVFFIFHMIKKRVGEDIFNRSLKRIYKDFKFKAASWNDLINMFESESLQNFNEFFEYWVKNRDIPVLKLDNVLLNKVKGSKYELSFDIFSKNSKSGAIIPFLISYKNKTEFIDLEIIKNVQNFKFFLDERPRYVSLDPDYDIFRRLYEEEIPSTLNDIMGSEKVLVVFSKGLNKLFLDEYKGLVKRLVGKPFDISDTKDLNHMDNYDTVIVVGKPERSLFDQLVTGDVSFLLQNGNFVIDGKSYPADSDLISLTAKLSIDKKKRVLFLFGNTLESIKKAKRPIPHYGKYGYLVFKDGKNYVKGTWKTAKTPLTYYFTKN